MFPKIPDVSVSNILEFCESLIQIKVCTRPEIMGNWLNPFAKKSQFPIYGGPSRVLNKFTVRSLLYAVQTHCHSLTCMQMFWKRTGLRGFARTLWQVIFTKTALVNKWNLFVFHVSFVSFRLDWNSTWLHLNLESSLPVETSARRTGVRSSFDEQKLLCHITWHKTDRQREHIIFLCSSWFCLFVVLVFPFDWSCCVWSEKKELDVSMWESREKQSFWHGIALV